MTNSDAFADIHQYRARHTLRALTVMHRQLAALIVNTPRMLQAFRVEELAPGSGLAGGGRSSDVADPTGNTAISDDRGARVRAEWELAVAEGSRALAKLTAITMDELHDPQPTGLCRHGDCPDVKTATRGTRTEEGTPRCEACYKFWLLDASNPAERGERQYRGQTPRRIGLEQGQVA